MSSSHPRLKAVLQAIFVTILWSSSWILIKIGLRSDLPPLTFAGLRYVTAFLCLVPVILLNPSLRLEFRDLTRKDWWMFTLLGLFTVALTQGAQYAALANLAASTTSLILNLTSLFVAISGVYLLREVPTSWQWTGIALTLLGVGLYFLPVTISGSEWTGLAFALLCLAGNVPASLLGRRINSTGRHSPILVTFLSLGIGSVVLLAVGLLLQGPGRLSTTDWLIVAWLAVVNTAFAFTLWNRTMRTLKAMESSIINNLMMPQIAFLAFVFLGESLSLKEITGLVLVGIGVLLVQIGAARASNGRT